MKTIRISILAVAVILALITVAHAQSSGARRGGDAALLTYTDDALAEANEYTDNETASTLATANEYTDNTTSAMAETDAENVFTEKQFLDQSPVIYDFYSTATGGGLTTLTDDTQTWTASALIGKTIVMTNDGTDYTKTITANDNDTVTFTTAIDTDTGATVTLGSGEGTEGEIEITAIGTITGTAGNDWSIIITIHDTETGSDTAADTITVNTDNKTATVDVDTSAEGAVRELTAANLATLINNDVTASTYFLADTGYTAGTIPATTGTAFSGGADGDRIAAGDVYYIFDTDSQPATVGAVTVQVVTEADNRTITEDEATNYIFTNTDAIAEVVFTLPAAVVGMGPLYFFVDDTDGLKIDPDGTETIGAGAAGHYFVADAVGEFIILMCLKTGTWSVVSSYGTWTEESE